jgi:hypothetical protein
MPAWVVSFSNDGSDGRDLFDVLNDGLAAANGALAAWALVQCYFDGVVDVFGNAAIHPGGPAGPLPLFGRNFFRFGLAKGCGLTGRLLSSLIELRAESLVLGDQVVDAKQSFGQPTLKIAYPLLGIRLHGPLLKALET